MHAVYIAGALPLAVTAAVATAYGRTRAADVRVGGRLAARGGGCDVVGTCERVRIRANLCEYRANSVRIPCEFVRILCEYRANTVRISCEYCEYGANT